MARPALPSASVVAAVRAHFSLDQSELAAWLGISQAQASHLETGRRALSTTVATALAPLVACLPAPATAAPALRLASATPTAPALALAPPEAAPLAARLDYCQRHARRLRRELRPLEEQATVAARWAAAMPTLLAALPPIPAHEPASTAPEWRGWFQHRWLAGRHLALPSPLSARYHLLRLQAEALEAEAQGLAELL